MTRVPRDDEREQRIHDEVIVDAYGPEEQAMSWYYYLQENLQFPFKARCIEELAQSPLRLGETADVVGMPPEASCEHDMLVQSRWQDRSFAGPAMQLEGLQVDELTVQALEDWRYWVRAGYML